MPMPDPKELNGFAVDFGGTKTAAARILDGQIADRVVAPTDGNAAPGNQVDAMANLLKSIGYHSGDRLGVAITGRVDSSGMWHAINQATLAEIRDVPVAKNIADEIGPATVANDAAAATLAEAKLGSGRGCENFGYITVSTGVGGGLFLGGRLHQSANGLAGHIGFSSSSLGTEMCGSGRRGTVESVASGNAIARAAAVAGHNGLNARGVFERANNGEEWAVTLIDRSARAVSDLCADLTTVLGLEVVALGGGIGMADGYLENVQKHLTQLPRLFQPKLTHSSLGHDAPLLGALLMAWQEV